MRDQSSFSSLSRATFLCQTSFGVGPGSHSFILFPASSCRHFSQTSNASQWSLGRKEWWECWTYKSWGARNAKGVLGLLHPPSFTPSRKTVHPRTSTHSLTLCLAGAYGSQKPSCHRASPRCACRARLYQTGPPSLSHAMVMAEECLMLTLLYNIIQGISPLTHYL